MATITRFPMVRHLRATATSHIEFLSKGRPRTAGVGASFWFMPLTSTISEIPVDDRELDAVARVRTSDLQEITVPIGVTYRFAEPDKAAARVDFSIDLAAGTWVENPLDTVGSMVYSAATAAVTGVLTGASLREALARDVAELADEAFDRIKGDRRLAEIGVDVVGVRLDMLRPDGDVERALQTPARESVQQEADKATFERRAIAVEREAAIGENELANQIELARRQQQLIAQKGANARREVEDAAEADGVRVQAEASRAATLAEAKAAATRALGLAEAEAESAKLDAYRQAGRDVMLALALRELAQNLPQVNQLVLTPDVITGALGALLGGDKSE